MTKKDRPLKSSYELAMERLRVKDRKDGVAPAIPLAEDQKDQIARLRGEARAKLAEMEILHKKNSAAVLGDPEKLAEIEEKHRIDRARVESRLASEIARVRGE